MHAIILGVRGLLLPQLAAPSRQRHSGHSTRLRSALRSLGDRAAVVLLERGPSDALEAWAVETGVAAVTTFRLWTARLGDQARPPSRLPFRFIQRRLDVRTTDSLYVGCDSGLLEAARRAGCCTWDVRTSAEPPVPPEIVDTVRWLVEPATRGLDDQP
jgi:hypothetical protein